MTYDNDYVCVILEILMHVLESRTASMFLRNFINVYVYVIFYVLFVILTLYFDSRSQYYFY